MPPRTIPPPIPIETLLLRTLLPAVVGVAMLLAVLVYDRLYVAIVDGFDHKLVTTSALTGAMIDPADHDRLITAARAGADAALVEATPAYRANVAPMARIRQALSLTYLYTQVVNGPGVLYVLDGSSGEDHSPIGTTDTPPADTLAGLQRVERDGAIYVSPIEYQEQWGLLKTAAAPIASADGRIDARADARIAGSAGADVNISVIRVATQNALFASALVGIGSIVACILLTLRLVSRIGGPLAALTQDTLRIAGGDPGGLATGRGPREVIALRSALQALIDTRATETETRALAASRARAATSRAVIAAEADDAREPVVLGANAERSVVWIAAPDENARTLLAHRAMAQLAAAETTGVENWDALVDHDRGACITIDRLTCTVVVTGPTTLQLRIGERVATLHRDTPEPFTPGETIAVLGADGSDRAVLG
jgi:hypothetical protein